jgi:transcriptional regulator with XRE-family HTH domain
MTNSETVNRAWGGQAPDWALALAQAADSGMSRRRLADLIGYSATAISQVLSGKYRGNKEKLAAAVRAALMHESVQCPVLGEISGEQCLSEQRKPLAATSGMRVRLWRACRGCGNNIGKEG